jgi:hypothetical protein
VRASEADAMDDVNEPDREFTCANKLHSSERNSIGEPLGQSLKKCESAFHISSDILPIR